MVIIHLYEILIEMMVTDAIIIVTRIIITGGITLEITGVPIFTHTEDLINSTTLQILIAATILIKRTEMIIDLGIISAISAIK